MECGKITWPMWRRRRPREVGLTVREVLQLSGSHEGAAMHHPRLQPWLTRRLSELSDGQKQQVMVARAMLQSQSWIVLDEPTAFLDVKGQADLWDMLTQHLEHGGSVLMATHDLRGVLRWAQSNEHARGSGSIEHPSLRDGLENVSWGIEEQGLIAEDKLISREQIDVARGKHGITLLLPETASHARKDLDWIDVCHRVFPHRRNPDVSIVVEGVPRHALVAHHENGVVGRSRCGVGGVFGCVFHVAYMEGDAPSPAEGHHVGHLCVDHPQVVCLCHSGA